MDSQIVLLSLPATLALLIKAAIFLFARKSKIHNPLTRLFLYFLAALAVQNVAEIMGFYQGYHGHLPAFEGFIYFAASIVALALLVHLALKLAAEPGWRHYNIILGFNYGFMVLLEGLLLFSDYLVSSFAPIAYTYSRVPGPLYFLFETFVIMGLALTISALLYGSTRLEVSPRRTKCQYMLIGILPLTLLVLTTIFLLHMGIIWFNSTVTLPMAVTFFLIVSAYATHNHRLFDVQFYIPWSKVRKRKTAFYDRIRNMITEIADLNTVSEVINRVADTLSCPVALICGNKPVLADAGNSRYMAQAPRELLQDINHIVVAREIESVMPKTYATMQRHGIAAIVPFYPHSQQTSGWLLLGDSFNNTVYTPLDFQMVEQLFERMADLFLDKQLLMRTELSKTKRELRTLKRNQQEILSVAEQLRSDNEHLRSLNQRLVNSLPADSINHTDDSEQLFGSTLVFLGRDKTMRKLLREQYPQTKYYVGPSSTGFRRLKLPDVLIYELQQYSTRDADLLLGAMGANTKTTACLLYGPEAERFLQTHRQQLLGTLTDVLLSNTNAEAILRRISALSALQKTVYRIPQTDYPILSKNSAYREAIAEAQYVAKFADPVLLVNNHVPEAISIAKYIHQVSGCEGGFAILQAAQLDSVNLRDRAIEVLETCRGGTVMLDNASDLKSGLSLPLLLITNEYPDVRYIVGSNDPDVKLPNSRLNWHKLNIPSLQQRREDIQALTYYYTLQFNLQSDNASYLSQREMDAISNNEQPVNLTALKRIVFQHLGHKGQQLLEEPEVDYHLTNKTLDEYVSNFEAKIIKQTLERCEGNKSKAARLLGLRPNTLHYKLERYGLSESKKRSKQKE